MTLLIRYLNTAKQHNCKESESRNTPSATPRDSVMSDEPIDPLPEGAPPPSTPYTTSAPSSRGPTISIPGTVSSIASTRDARNQLHICPFTDKTRKEELRGNTPF